MANNTKIATSSLEFLGMIADGAILISRDLNVASWNKAMTRLTGIGEEVARGRPVAEHLKIKSMPLLLTHLEFAFEGNSFVIQTPFSWIERDDEKVSISLSYLEGEEACLLLCRPVDRNENSRLMEMVRSSPFPTALFAEDGTALYFNRVYAGLWGFEYTGLDPFHYNILQDEQLEKFGIMEYIQRAFKGEMVHLPYIPYNPSGTEHLKVMEIDTTKYLKGYIFPMQPADAPFHVLLVLRDVTEQIQAEEILKLNNRQFEMMTNSIPGVVYEYHLFDDGSGVFEYISQGCVEMFGLRVEEVYANANFAYDLIHPDDREQFIQSLKQREKKNQIWRWEGRIIVEGRVKWIVAKSKTSFSEDGAAIRYGLIQDITEKKNYEARQKKTEERLQIALQAANAGIWEWDIETNRRTFNESWMKKCGYSARHKETFFESWESLIHPEDLDRVKNELRLYLKRNVTIYESEYRFKKANGEYFWVNERGSSTSVDISGKVLHATGTVTDIQQIKLNRDKILRQEQLFTQLFNNAPVGIVLLNEEFVVQQVNPGFVKIFGYVDEEIVLQDLDRILVPDELREESEEMNASTLRGDIRMLETHRTASNGRPVPVIIYSVPVVFQDRTIGIYGIYVDITERKKVERELQVRNHELDNFVYKVSHDLRAPLTSIMGLSNLAMYEKGSGDPYVYINMIDNRIRQLDNFIKDILSHSKNLKLDIVYSQINFEKLIQECFESLNYLPQVGQIKKRVTVTGEEFFSDYWRISEVMRNLISNAIKYSNPHADSYIEIDIRLESTHAAIYFGDNGIGIDESNLPKVFEMFYRATEAAEGSGIGLYIVKNAIDRLGGVIRIWSKPNKGTSFEITLPNAAKQQVQAENAV